MNLPPFPEGYLPSTPEERIRMLACGEECAMAGAEAYKRGVLDADARWRDALTEARIAAIDAASNAQHSTDGGTE